MAKSENGSPPGRRLGRGLAALLGDVTAAPEVEAQLAASAREAPIEWLRPNPRNPRQLFAEDELNDLAQSIRERGIIQPIIVRPVAGEKEAYEIIAGERRWRAAQRAGKHAVPIVVQDVGDREALEISIIENVQRYDLNGLEEAKGYAQLASDYGYSHTDIGRVVGKSRSHIANTTRLLALPEHTKELLAAGKLTAGHARALLAVPDPDAVADRIVAKGLSVRDVERIANGAPAPVKPRAAAENEVAIQDMEKRLATSLGAAIKIKATKRSCGLYIKLKNAEQLEYICEKLLGG